MILTAARPLAGQEGLDPAFETCLRQESGRLFGIAYTILQDVHEAEDAVQEVSLRAWRAWSRTADHPSPRPWLTRICVNHCLTRRSWMRRRRNRTAELLPSLQAPEREANDPVLAAACARLSRQQRAVVFLHYHYGYQLNECADLMGCGRGSVRTHLHRALTTLREVLEDD